MSIAARQFSTDSLKEKNESFTKNPGKNKPFDHGWRSASFSGDVVRYPFETSSKTTEPTVQDRFDPLRRQNKQNYQFDCEKKGKDERKN